MGCNLAVEGGRCEARWWQVARVPFPVPIPLLSPPWSMVLLRIVSPPASAAAREHLALAVALHVGE